MRDKKEIWDIFNEKRKHNKEYKIVLVFQAINDTFKQYIDYNYFYYFYFKYFFT